MTSVQGASYVNQWHILKEFQRRKRWVYSRSCTMQSSARTKGAASMPLTSLHRKRAEMLHSSDTQRQPRQNASQKIEPQKMGCHHHFHTSCGVKQGKGDLRPGSLFLPRSLLFSLFLLKIILSSTVMISMELGNT